MQEARGDHQTDQLMTENEAANLATAARQYEQQTGEGVREFADLIWLTVEQKMQLVGAYATLRVGPDQANVPDVPGSLQAGWPALSLVPNPRMEPARRARMTEWEQTDAVTHVQRFVQEAKKWPLLRPEEEVQLGRRIQAGQQAAERLSTASYASVSEKIRDMTVMTDGLYAKQDLVHANLRLIMKPARYTRRNHPMGRRFGLMDLVQEGYRGLNRAAEKFDPELGWRFSTYALIWIRDAIGKAVTPKLRENYALTGKVRELENRGLRDEQIADSLDITAVELADIRAYRHHLHPTSVDQVIDRADGFSETLIDKMADPSSEEGFEKLFDPEDDTSSQDLPVDSLLDVVRTLAGPKDADVLEKILADEQLIDKDMRRILKLRGLLQHPVLRARLKELLPDFYSSDGIDWRDKAACIDHPKIFVSKGRRGSAIATVCGECTVKDACERYFWEERPERGRWAGGLSYDMNLVKRQGQESKPSD